MGDLLLEQVLLVEEQNDGRLCEPLVVADRVEQLHALMHPVLGGTGANVEIKRLLGSSTRTHRGNEFTETQPPLTIWEHPGNYKTHARLQSILLISARDSKPYLLIQVGF